ncbi:MAG: hypothetical protein ACRYFX_07510 [Janthinobacterium lividum]
MPLPATTYPPDVFTLEYRPEPGILVGRWLRPVSMAEAQVTYAAVLAAAQAHGNCHRWLLDVRRRSTGDPTITQWFGTEFGPRLAGALGGPVAIAYFAMIDHSAATDSAELLRNIEQAERQGNHYRYFNQEGEALAWLAGQPA